MFVINCLCSQCTKNFNCFLKVTIASQEAMKERSYRGVVRPRHVVPRFVVPRDQGTEVHSNYETAFNDEFWPKMWYFVSMSYFFFFKEKLYFTLFYISIDNYYINNK